MSAALAVIIAADLMALAVLGLELAYPADLRAVRTNKAPPVLQKEGLLMPMPTRITNPVDVVDMFIHPGNEIIGHAPEAASKHRESASEVRRRQESDPPPADPTGPLGSDGRSPGPPGMAACNYERKSDHV